MTGIDWEHAQGWRPFGYHMDLSLPAGWRLEFAGVDETGLPVWERLERVGDGGGARVSWSAGDPF